MKKDVLIAVSIGIVIGAFIALIVINLPTLIPNKSISNIPRITPTKPDSNEIKAQMKQLSLVIENPQDAAISKSSTLEVTGIATFSSLIIVDTKDGPKTVKAHEDGKFSVPVDLNEGGNEIFITAYNENGDSSTTTLTAFYTSEKL